MTACFAEGWVKEADSRANSSAGFGNFAAGRFYEKAIQIYRSIPRKDRVAVKADDRIEDLFRLMASANDKALGEMTSHSSPSIDISDLIQHSRKAVSGKMPLDALLKFCRLYPAVKVNELRDAATETLKSSVLHHLFGATQFSADARVVARRPAGGGGIDPSKADVLAQMVRDYLITVGLVVQGCVLPALDILVIEHPLHEGDFVGLAQQSPIVPYGWEQLVGKGLFAGYDRDFMTALHFLVPQIEHLVRMQLKAVGAKTTTLSPEGIETENGLSALLDMPEIEKAFEENLAFELKALFCDPVGPNLRNDLDHGLLGDGPCQSAPSIYAWWFCLRLVLNTYWNAN